MGLGREGAELLRTSQGIQEAKNPSRVVLPKPDIPKSHLQGALVLQSIEWVNVMKGGSQCPARLNIVDFPGKLEKKKKKKKFKYNFPWEQKRKVNIVLKVMTTS